MAAASGPVETSSGRTLEMEPNSTERPGQNETVEQEGSNEAFKVPQLCTPKPEKKKTDSGSTTAELNTSTKSRPDNRKKIPDSSEVELKQTRLSVPYKEPLWGGVPPDSEKYSFDVLKNGTVMENIELGKKPWIVFGRLPSCDVFMEHPSLSRHHAVVQYRDNVEDGQERGWYLYDLDSTHGTWVNKEKIKPKIYQRLRVGYVIKFGGSSRLYILQGPDEDREPESELSVTELKQQTARLKRETEVLKQAELDQEEENERQRQKILELRGCSWGMGEDATEESEENPFAASVSNLLPQHEHLYVDDPKKALKGFYEREGYDLPDYQFQEVGFGKHKCVVDLPVDGPNGEILIAEATVSGKKKEAVVACALEACRLLDIHGMLHASKHASKRKKDKNWEDNDFYDSDEDTFLDRTGTIEKKRIFRMRKSGKEEKAETYESLLPQHQAVKKRIAEISFKIEQAKAQADAAAGDEEDALEAYMSAIKAGVMDTKTRLALKRELLTLRTEEERLRRLVNIAKPAEMPELKKLESDVKKPAVCPAFIPGVRKIGMSKSSQKHFPIPVMDPVNQTSDEGFQVEEDDDDDNNTTETAKILSASALSPQTEKRESEISSKPEISDSNPCSVSQEESNVDSSEENANRSSVLSSVKVLASQTVSKKLEDKSSDSVVKGPTLPANLNRSSDAAEEESATEKQWAGKRFAQPSMERPTQPPPKKKKKNTAPREVDYDASDPNYAMWMPPKNQSGDGRTSLNDKLGY